MKNKGITKYEPIHKHGITQNTISRMVKNKATSNNTINDLCKILNCNVQDIMIYITDEDLKDL